MIRRILIFLYIVLYSIPAYAQISTSCIQDPNQPWCRNGNIIQPTINTNTAVKIPSMTTTQRNALTGANGLMIYNTTTSSFQKYENGAWVDMAGGGSGDVTDVLGTTHEITMTNSAGPQPQVGISTSPHVIGAATSVLTGSIDPAASTSVVGVGTLFTTELSVGDRITVTGETRTVIVITDNTHLTVDTAFSDNANDTTPDKLAAVFETRISSGALAVYVDDLGGLNLGTDLKLSRDAANVLALKNGASAQELRIYGTTTGPKYLSLSHDGSISTILASGDMYLEGGTGTKLYLGSNASVQWYMKETAPIGSLLAVSDNTIDIGAAGANRPRSIYAGTSIITPIVNGTTAIVKLFPGGSATDGTGSGNNTAALSETVSTGTQTADSPKTTHLKLLFDGTTDEHWTFSLLLPNDYTSGGTLRGVVIFTSATTGVAGMKGSIVCSTNASTDNDAMVFNTVTYSSAISAPGTQGQSAPFTVALTTTGMAANRHCNGFIGRDADNTGGAADDITTDLELESLNLEYLR